MTSNPSIKLPIRNVTPANKVPKTEQAMPNAYSPAVPISVYRELAAELQAAQAMMESLNAQNQHLARQNQQLREEIEKVVQSHLHLHQLAASFQPIGRVEPPQAQVQIKSDQRVNPVRNPQVSPVKSPAPFSTAPAPAPKPEPILAYEVEETFTEQEEGRYQRSTPAESNSSVSGWFLIIAIFLIVTTAFSAGFLIIRPLLDNSNSSNSR